MIPRRTTRKITLGDEAHGFVSMGGGSPVSVQSMTAGYTYEIDKCVAEIQKLTAAGADVVRVAVPEIKDTIALKEILPQVTVVVYDSSPERLQRVLQIASKWCGRVYLLHSPDRPADVPAVNRAFRHGLGSASE